MEPAPRGSGPAFCIATFATCSPLAGVGTNKKHVATRHPLAVTAANKSSKAIASPADVFVRSLALLPLDLIGVGEVATVGMAVARSAGRKVVNQMVGRGFYRGAEGVLHGAEFVTETAPRFFKQSTAAFKNAMHEAAQPVVNGGIHGGIGKVLGNQSRIYIKAVNWADRNGWKACFAGDVPMRTPTGHVLARDVREGDLLLSRDEFDPDGMIVAQRVEAVFERFASVVRLSVRGREIRTTAEHPFYVESQGWTACHELRAGDAIRLDDGWAGSRGGRRDGVVGAGV